MPCLTKQRIELRAIGFAVDDVGGQCREVVGLQGRLSPKHDGPAAVVKIVRGLGGELREQFSHAAQFFGARGFLALRIVGHPDVVGLVGGQIEILHALVGIQQILEHAEQQLVGVGIGGAEFVIALGVFAQTGIFGMFQDECDVARCVQVGDELHVMAQAVIGQFLKLGGRERVRLHQGRRAPVLEVALQLEGESVHLEERRLPDGLLQRFDAVEMMGIVPVKLAHLKVGPVFDFAFGEHEGAVARLQQLHESHDAVVQAGRRVCRRSSRDRGSVRSCRPARARTSRSRSCASPTLAEFGAMTRRSVPAGRADFVSCQWYRVREFLVEDFECRIAGRNSLRQHIPIARKREVRGAQTDGLRLRHHDVPSGE